MAKLPESIGKFRVQSLLGRGAMGVVYKALDPDIERIVAIKLVRTDLLEGDDRAHHLARLRNEARVVGRCIHPNIVGIYDLAMHEGNPFLVLEFVDGVDLGKTYRRGTQIDLPTAGHIALGVLEALSYAHGFGVIHRDIKPANVLLTGSDAVKVTDFGISRVLVSEATMSSVLVGTPCYMSPEQCLGGSIDPRSDIFSMGSVLYEMLTGAQCFAGSNLVATMHNILHTEPAAIVGLRPDLPAPVIRVVETALAKRAEDRFQSAAEMAQALRSALRGEGALAERDDDPTVVAPAAGQSQPSRRGAAELEALQPTSLATMERRLAHYLGPMAAFHLRRTMREADSPEAFTEKLAELIPEEKAREQMRADLLQIIAADSGLITQRSGTGQLALSGAHNLPLGTIDAVTRALTLIMGPIAPHLLRRALKTATTPAELEAVCLEMIDNTQERARFRELLAGHSPSRD